MRLSQFPAALFVLLICVVACSDADVGSGGDGADAGEDASYRDAADGGDTGDEIPEEAVSTTEGPVIGQQRDDVWSYRGMPYARPPVGERRWAPPEPPEQREELFEADAFGPACPQDTDGALGGDPGPTDEDCLTLNVWTPQPEPDADLPVMVWIHGGGHIQGSARQALADGTTIYDAADLADEGVVVVTLNYRLGALGFLAHEAFFGEDDTYQKAGNYGLLDQVRALEWVQDNIAQMGGDPDNVTLFGESAGAISTCALMTAADTKDLFDRGLMQSGNCLANADDVDDDGEDSPRAVGQEFADEIGCADADDVAACLREQSVEDILATLPGTVSGVGERGDGQSYHPIVDGHLLEKPPAAALADGDAHDKPLLMGVNGDEGTLFASPFEDISSEEYEQMVQDSFPNQYEDVLDQYPVDDFDEPWKALAAIIGDVGFVCPTRAAARAHTRAGQPVYTYYYTHETAVGERFDWGAFHGSELSFVFGNFGSLQTTAAEERLSAAMQTYWTQFAATGEPGEFDGVDWPAYDASEDEGVEFVADDLGTIDDFRSEYCDFWRR